ncbi:PRC-barrel domain-containing protein [Mesorhizobium sp. ANAO-SY3R2]|uniref:PRC-barrel domain-containing protein n=1 Tax=Mesorhizobium sp. ANAO-SY3R2 TaxID=3166644 RepID=UPI00366BDB8F
MRRALIALATTAVFLGAAHAQTAETTTTQEFVTAQPTDVLSYNLVGLDIKNSADETVGEIKDLVLSNDTLAGYIVSVGGFLGMDEHYVIVSPKAVKITYVENDKKWTATMDATKEQLKAAPGFKYEGRWDRK